MFTKADTYVRFYVIFLGSFWLVSNYIPHPLLTFWVSIPIIFIVLSLTLKQLNFRYEKIFADIGIIAIFLIAIIVSNGLNNPGSYLLMVAISIYLLFSRPNILSSHLIIINSLLLITLLILHRFEVLQFQYTPVGSFAFKYLGIQAPVMFATYIPITLFVVYLHDKNKKSIIALENKNKEQNKLLSLLNHEIRNPLNGLINILPIIEQHKNEPHLQDKYLQIAYTNGKVLKETLEQSLQLQKIDSNNFTVKNSTLDLRSWLAEHLTNYSSQITNKKIELTSTFSPDFPQYVCTDQRALNVIVNNLLSNAIKFTHHGYISVSVSHQDNNMVIKIKDTGIGIAQKQQKSIFLPFTQLDEGESKQYEGAGLGLALLQRCVDVLHGSISLKSELNVGSEFTLTIPVEFKHEMIKPKKKLKIDNLIDLTDVVVVIIDDHKVNLEILKLQLKFSNANIKAFSNPVMACEFCKSHHVDIIISDISMPQMDGIALLKKLSAKSLPPVRIAVTGNTLAEQQQKYFVAGYQDIITKPYDLDVLYTCINTLYQRHLQQA
jgi:signal transduction histidine kinase